MLFNYFKLSIRNIFRYKGISGITITGLMIAYAFALLSAQYISHEFGYDRFHEKADRIYLLVSDRNVGGITSSSAVSTSSMAELLQKWEPSVESVCRFMRGADILISYKNNQFFETDYLYADPSFFDIFDLELTRGDKQTALVHPNTIIIAEEKAKRYFGNDDPVGQYLTEEDGGRYLVTGVFKPLPANSQLNFNFLASMRTFDQEWSEEKRTMIYQVWTYVLLKEGASLPAVRKALDSMTESYIGNWVKKDLKTTLEEFRKSGNSYSFDLRPLTDIHLDTSIDATIEPSGDSRYISILAIVSLLILAIACINFIILATARSANRAREVGMRKVLGSDRQQIMRQFIIESILLSCVAMVGALSLSELSLSAFNHLMGTELVMADLKHPLWVTSLVFSPIIVGILAGLYPSLILASGHPIYIMKGTFQSKMQQTLIRNGLVTFQLTIAIFALITTFFIREQLLYVREKNLGINQDNILSLHLAYGKSEDHELIKEKISTYPGVLSTTTTLNLPGKLDTIVYIQGEHAAPTDITAMRYQLIDVDYLTTMGVKMKQGRFFDFDEDEWKQFKTKRVEPVLLNETAVRLLNLKEPLNSVLRSSNSNSYQVVGVIQDYHFESLHQKIRPLMMLANMGIRSGYILMKLHPDHIDRTLSYLHKLWLKVKPGHPFAAVFLNDYNQKLYENEERMAFLFALTSIFTILIACMGLLGQISFNAERRTKEIGIRKALGASIPDIISLLSKEIFRLLGYATLIACPLAYLVVQNWLNHFAYRIHIDFWPFLFGTSITFFLAMTTVLIQSTRAAWRSPADALRYE